MTRILYWNLSQFSQKKVNAGGAEAVPSQQRLAHILANVFVPNAPDIFVIVECYAALREVGFWGTLTSANVRNAVTVILGQLQALTANPWCVIPPICTGEVGFREGVAVFFNSANLQFNGPYAWGPDYATWFTRFKAPIERACPVARTQRPAAANPAWLNGPQAYPAVWAGALPAANSAVLDAAGNAIPQNQLAPQWEFADGAGNALTFPYSVNRAPQLVEFAENPGAANQRTIKLFTVHTTPTHSTGGVQQIGNIAALPPVGAGDVSVVLGDFNEDTINALGSYAAIEAAGFTMNIDPRNGGAAAVPASRPYCQTHYLPANQATPFNAVGVIAPDPTHNPAPAFGYLGTLRRQWGIRTWVPHDAAAIDNVFTSYVPAPAALGLPAAAANMTVINCAVGTPYPAVPGGVAAGLAGALAYPSSMANPIPAAGVVDNPPASNAALTQFRAWANFGLIRSTSDHLPLVVDV